MESFDIRGHRNLRGVMILQGKTQKNIDSAKTKKADV